MLIQYRLFEKQLYSDKQENSDSMMQTKFDSAVKQLYKGNSKESSLSWNRFIVDSVRFNNCVKSNNFLEWNFFFIYLWSSSREVISSSCSVQFSSNSVHAVKSIILPNIMFPQLSKPKGVSDKEPKLY